MGAKMLGYLTMLKVEENSQPSCEKCTKNVPLNFPSKLFVPADQFTSFSFTIGALSIPHDLPPLLSGKNLAGETFSVLGTN